MCKFFDQDGKEINEGDFIDHYCYFYYTDSTLILKGTRRQCSRYVEGIIDGLLDNGIKNQRDVMHILAWKLARVNHNKSDNSFKYLGKWEPLNKLEDTEEKNIEKAFNDILNFQLDNAYGNELDPDKIKKLVNDIVQFCSDPGKVTLLSAKNNEEAVRDLIVEKPYKNPVNIGPVYQITLLYFMSKGEYPIYDQFADKALNAILNNKKPGEVVAPLTRLPQKKSGKKDSDNPEKEFKKKLMAELKPSDNIKTDKKYMAYKKRIELVFGDYEKTYRASRDIDRALWVYGHLFPSKSANSN